MHAALQLAVVAIAYIMSHAAHKLCLLSCALLQITLAVLAFHDHLTLLNLLGLLLAIAGTWLYKMTRPRAAGAAGARRTGEGGELSYAMVAQEDLIVEVLYLIMIMY